VAYCDELLLSAEKLLSVNAGETPSVSDCNRAVSTAYYAAFSLLCSVVANRLVGKEENDSAKSGSWLRVSRSIDHIKLKVALHKLAKVEPDDFWGYRGACAAAFEKLQTARTDADYDTTKSFNADEAKQMLAEAEVFCLMVRATPKNDPEWLGDLSIELFLPKQTR
jgi:uncharacterized protein (UPF0332 family)